ncbi:(4Fe-4S)-binding protein [Mobilicoccus sp.]|uniref:(4Fe-4S)-binding protein n=2 Tax=Mobilicoccus sp. TaxID=2034349 RepID=UPI0028ABCACA|nr:(4Fe-4S)-binding protein [Mobilicoccus sp.]
MTRKTFTGPIVDVSFDGELCRHAAECVNGMPEVVDVSRRPWIDPGQAADPDRAAHLREVVGRGLTPRSGHAESRIAGESERICPSWPGGLTP